MSAAPITQAHRELVVTARRYTMSHEQAAQAIADSEARAVAQQTVALALMIIRCNETEKERDTLRDERDRLNRTLEAYLSTACDKCGVGYLLPSGVCDNCDQPTSANKPQPQKTSKK